MVELNSLLLSGGDRSAMEAYISERTHGVSVPVDVLGPVASSFHVFDIKTLWDKGGPTAVLHPTKGGFVISLRIPPARRKDFRSVVAHEFAHTFFYRYRGTSKTPLHVAHSQEESLCQYGARALLIPCEALPSKSSQLCSLPEILRLAQVFQVPPKWMAARLFCDLQIKEAAFFVYRFWAGRMKKTKQVVALSRPFTRRMLADLRAYIRESQSSKVKADGCYLGPMGRGAHFDIEVVERRATLFDNEADLFVLAHPK